MKTINILGDVIAGESDRWFASEVSPAQVIDALKEANGEEVEILINSNGGSVVGGLAIANAIKTYPGETTCVVLGVAASMASVVACAGKRLKMGEGSFVMIHNPWTMTVGNAEDLRKDADVLDKMRDSILGFYMAKCPGQTEEEFKELMDGETWISRDYARELGFQVEDYEGELKAAASLTRRPYGNAPDSVKALFEVRTEKPDQPEGNAHDQQQGQAAENAAETSSETGAEAPASAPQAEEAETAADNAEAAESVQAPSGETPEEKPEDKPQGKAEKPVAPVAPAAPADNWEARFKGLSKKYGELKQAMASAAEARDAEIATLTSQLKKSGEDLAAANAKASELAAKLEDSAKALQAATEDLAKTRDSLKIAEDKARELESTRDMLTAGVLTPPAAGTTYADQIKAAKTPEAREALREAKRKGKIK